jgi:hypothetical protein
MMILIAYIAQTQAKELSFPPTHNGMGDTQASMDTSVDKLADTLVDKMLERTLKALPLHFADLDDTTLGKPGHLAIRGQATAGHHIAVQQPVSAGWAGAGRGRMPLVSTSADKAGAHASRNPADDSTKPEPKASSWLRRDALAGMAGVAVLQGAAPSQAYRKGIMEPGGKASARGGRNSPEIADSLFKPIPGTEPPIRYYDLQGGGSASGGIKDGQRVAVHYDLRWRRLTIGTSRMGMGVTGGQPYGFNVGIRAGKPGGPFINAFNEGIKGMKVGTIRRLKVPPEYGYGGKQMQEIPPNSEITLDIELMDVKRGPS